MKIQAKKCIYLFDITDSHASKPEKVLWLLLCRQFFLKIVFNFIPTNPLTTEFFVAISLPTNTISCAHSERTEQSHKGNESRYILHRIFMRLEKLFKSIRIVLRRGKFSRRFWTHLFCSHLPFYLCSLNLYPWFYGYVRSMWTYQIFAADKKL